MRYSIITLSVAFFLLSCGQSSNSKKEPASADTAKTGTTTSLSGPDTAMNKLAESYHPEQHGDINAFMTDLANAVGANDKNGVAQMIQFPLADEYGDNPQNQSTPLGCKNAAELMEKYDQVFVAPLKAAIAAKKFRAADNTNKEVDDVIKNGEYLIEYTGSDAAGKRPDIMLGVKKVDGKFKVYAIKFYS